MKPEANKTTINEVGENWYQRTHKLRIVWQDKTKPEEKRKKAFFLFLIMQARVLKVAQEISKSRIIKPRFEIGGVVNQPDSK